MAPSRDAAAARRPLQFRAQARRGAFACAIGAVLLAVSGPAAAQAKSPASPPVIAQQSGRRSSARPSGSVTPAARAPEGTSKTSVTGASRNAH